MTLPVFIQWAGSNTTYVAGPDNTFPVEVQPGFVFFTPGNTLPAEALNYVLGQLSRECAVIPSAALNNWTPAAPVASILGGGFMRAMTYDNWNKLWWTAGNGTHVAVSADDGQTWQAMGATPSANANGMGPLLFGGGASIVFGGGTNIQFVSLAGVVTDTGTHLGLANITGSVVFPLAPSGRTIGILYDLTTGASKAYKTLDGITIVDVTGSLPSTWTTAASQPFMSHFSWCRGATNTQAIVGWGGNTPTTNPSQLLHMTWDGSSGFVSVDLTLPVAISNKRITGVAYNSTTATYGVVCNDGVPNSYLYQSSDLITWTLTNTVATNAALSLASVGSYWVMTIPQAIGGTTYHRAYGSLDGYTFSPLGTSLEPTIFGVGNPGFLAAGDGSIAMWTVNGAQFTRRIG